MEMLEGVQNSKSRLVGLKVNSPFSVRVSPILPPYSLHSLYFLLAIFLLFFFISFFKIHMIIRFRFNTPPSLSIRIQFLSFLRFNSTLHRFAFSFVNFLIPQTLLSLFKRPRNRFNWSNNGAGQFPTIEEGCRFCLSLPSVLRSPEQRRLTASRLSKESTPSDPSQIPPLCKLHKGGLPWRLRGGGLRASAPSTEIRGGPSQRHFETKLSPSGTPG